MRRSQGFVVALLFVGLAAAGPTAARSGAPGTGDGESLDPRDIAAFAKQVERAAAEHGARVFIVARKGRPADELPDGIAYTHVGLAVYSTITLEDGRAVPGYAMHNLYQWADRPGRSRIVVDYPAEFFTGVFSLEAAVIIPTPALQARLLEAVGDGTFEALHNPRYSAISNPFDPRFQNCTEHLLDVINGAIYRTRDTTMLKRYARDWFRPQRLHVGGLRLLLGGIFSEEVAISDHQGAAYTATFDTIRDYLDTNGLLDAVLEIAPAGVRVVER